MKAIKTLLYMGTMHGIFTYYLPVQLAALTARSFHFGVFRFLAFLFWAAGTLIILRCSVDIVRRGRGTPAHLDPPKTLLVSGIYRHVRNPIYLGAVIAQFGHILWFGSGAAVSYTLLYILGFHLLIVFVEEPILRNSFSADYEEYCWRVPRWLPKIK